MKDFIGNHSLNHTYNQFISDTVFRVLWIKSDFAKKYPIYVCKDFIDAPYSNINCENKWLEFKNNMLVLEHIVPAISKKYIINDCYSNCNKLWLVKYTDKGSGKTEELYFNAVYVGWVLYRLNTVFKLDWYINYDKMMLLFKSNFYMHGGFISGVMGIRPKQKMSGVK